MPNDQITVFKINSLKIYIRLIWFFKDLSAISLRYSQCWQLLLDSGIWSESRHDLILLSAGSIQEVSPTYGIIEFSNSSLP